MNDTLTINNGEEWFVIWEQLLCRVSNPIIEGVLTKVVDGNFVAGCWIRVEVVDEFEIRFEDGISGLEILHAVRFGMLPHEIHEHELVFMLLASGGN